MHRLPLLFLRCLRRLSPSLDPQYPVRSAARRSFAIANTLASSPVGLCPARFNFLHFLRNDRLFGVKGPPAPPPRPRPHCLQDELTNGEQNRRESRASERLRRRAGRAARGDGTEERERTKGEARTTGRPTGRSHDGQYRQSQQHGSSGERQAESTSDASAIATKRPLPYLSTTPRLRRI